MPQLDRTLRLRESRIRARRRFFDSCGRYAAVTPPRIARMLSGFETSPGAALAEFSGAADNNRLECGSPGSEDDDATD